ncbi:putative phosphatidate phosphatase [Culicoides brevitarsis]|uniref:putative phosphatidate phosphatase n=1 Tax=Culicoides brevitarsis TaxID=469753 RepID=UPI00307C5D6F
METENDENPPKSTPETKPDVPQSHPSAKMRVFKDILFLLFLAFPMILYKILQLVINRRHHGGFFCDDPTLQFPYKESTISETTVVLQTLLVPIFSIILVEYYHNKGNDASCDKTTKKVNVTNLLYTRIAHYIFGYIACCSFMWLPKYFDGNLRPHFLDVCRPVMPDGSDCSDTRNHGKFILDYECGNPDFFISIYRTFPSGHSSQAFFGATYLVMYFQRKLKNERFRIGIQFLLLLYAYAVSISRIYDWHHHGKDVVVGAAIGVFCAMVTCIVVENSFKKKTEETKTQS